MNLVDLIHRACLLEASARKVGNVHPAAAFESLCYADFVRSADAVAPVLARAVELGVGRTILEAVRATRAVCTHNTNLGIILLLAPLAAVPESRPLGEGLGDVLKSLTIEDSAFVFDAIRVASPRGLGNSSEQDVAQAPTQPLVEIMQLAADRDSIAAQYTTGFELVLRQGVPVLAESSNFETDWERAIIRLQLRLMAAQPDTDIARKCDAHEARESARIAQEVLASGWPDTTSGQQRLSEFDGWLRARGSLRNPGTTADLVTACLFVGLRERLIQAPSVAVIQKHAADIEI